MLRVIRDSKNEKEKVGVMIIKNYSWEEGLAGIIKGEECEVKGQRCRGQLWEKTIDVSGKEKETAQG